MEEGNAVIQLRKLMYRIGHRGAFLIFLFLLDELYGFSLLEDPFPPGIHWFIQPHTWAYVWMVTGALLLTGVIFRADYFQFALASLIKVAWAFTWVRIWIFNDVPRAWVSAIIWLAFAALVTVVATWTEPPRFQRILRNGRIKE